MINVHMHIMTYVLYIMADERISATMASICNKDGVSYYYKYKNQFHVIKGKKECNKKLPIVQL